MTRRRFAPVAFAALFAAAGTAHAQSPLPGGLPPPPGMPMPVYARDRFPQPVVVAQLVGAVVQRPLEDQAREGSVRAIIRAPDGTLAAVIHVGATLGIGGRDIAVPLDAMALLGAAVEVVGYTPAELRRFPSVRRSGGYGGATILPANAIVRVGLAKPSH